MPAAERDPVLRPRGPSVRILGSRVRRFPFVSPSLHTQAGWRRQRWRRLGTPTPACTAPSNIRNVPEIAASTTAVVLFFDGRSCYCDGCVRRAAECEKFQLPFFAPTAPPSTTTTTTTTGAHVGGSGDPGGGRRRRPGVLAPRCRG